ncbi:MAG: hypothetical protein M5U34_22795 [Chloroflexi bacterium]|nr:hypothetical protein [Chloroflexota bacterium]
MLRPLHGRSQFKGQRFLQFRQIFVDELVLQVDGIGGDDYAPAVLLRPKCGGQQVGDAFARARTRFDEGMTTVIEGFSNGR